MKLDIWMQLFHLTDTPPPPPPIFQVGHFRETYLCIHVNILSKAKDIYFVCDTSGIRRTLCNLKLSQLISHVPVQFVFVVAVCRRATV